MRQTKGKARGPRILVVHSQNTYSRGKSRTRALRSITYTGVHKGEGKRSRGYPIFRFAAQENADFKILPMLLAKGGEGKGKKRKEAEMENLADVQARRDRSGGGPD